jgi:hypothetical protein
MAASVVVEKERFAASIVCIKRSGTKPASCGGLQSSMLKVLARVARFADPKFGGFAISDLGAPSDSRSPARIKGVGAPCPILFAYGVISLAYGGNRRQITNDFLQVCFS